MTNSNVGLMSAAAPADPRVGRSLEGRAGRVEGSPEQGQIGVLVLCWFVIGLALIFGVVNVTAVQLARARLYDVADAAALDAADALAERTAYTRGVDELVPVTDATVRDAAQGYLTRTRLPMNVESWNVGGATGTPDGLSARVELTGQVEMPMANGFLQAITGGVRITVASTATSRLQAL